MPRAISPHFGARSRLPNCRGASTLFLGGGTPNTYAAADIAGLVALVRERFLAAPDAEISIEVNPDLALCEAFAAYRTAGINRISIGVQSFVDDEIRVLGRRHRAEDIPVVVGRARDAGFDAISIDLMFGLPGQTPASLDHSLDAALALDVSHISIYGLTVEEETPYAVWRAREPQLFDDDVREAELYDRIIERLERSGFEQYELSNFARPGYRCRHNANYWANGDYYGFGVGAASYIDGMRSTRTKSLDAYCTAIESGQPVPCESECLEGAARLGEAIMLALRRREGVDLATFASRYGVDVLATYAPVVSRMRTDGMLEHDDASLRLTRAGRFVANDVCAAFLAPAAA